MSDTEYKLTYPIMVNGERIDTLTLRRLNYGDIRYVQSKLSDDNNLVAERLLFLERSLSSNNLTPADIEKLDYQDVAALVETMTENFI